jgi:hypothetical protein
MNQIVCPCSSIFSIVMGENVSIEKGTKYIRIKGSSALATLEFIKTPRKVKLTMRMIIGILPTANHIN